MIPKGIQFFSKSSKESVPTRQEKRCRCKLIVDKTERIEVLNEYVEEIVLTSYLLEELSALVRELQLKVRLT